MCIEKEKQETRSDKGIQRAHLPLIKYKSPNLNTLPRNPRPPRPQIKRTMRHREPLPLLRVIRLENRNLGVQLIGHPVPLVVDVVLHLEDLVGDGGEHFVDSVEVFGAVDGERVEVGHGEVAAGA